MEQYLQQSHHQKLVTLITCLAWQKEAEKLVDVMNLIGVRQRLHDLCQDAGSIRAWSDERGLAFSYVSAVIRGDSKPGNKILKAMGLRKSFSLRKDAVMKFEDI